VISSSSGSGASGQGLWLWNACRGWKKDSGGDGGVGVG